MNKFEFHNAWAIQTYIFCNLFDILRWYEWSSKKVVLVFHRHKKMVVFIITYLTSWFGRFYIQIFQIQWLLMYNLCNFFQEYNIAHKKITSN